MTLNRMGKTSRAGLRNLGNRRAWIAGALAVGVVATSGAVASATLQGPPSTTKTEVSAEDCLNLDEKTMKAIFEAWKKQGGRSGGPTTGAPTGGPTDMPTGETTGSTPASESHDASPHPSHSGRKTASVPLSELSISPCEGGPGSTDPGNTDPDTTDPGTTDPGNTDPGNTDPGTTDPDTTDPGNTDPGNTDPGNTPTVTSTAS
jgi:hypothetical protein